MPGCVCHLEILCPIYKDLILMKNLHLILKIIFIEAK